MANPGIITLVTDFGTRDPYAGAVCGAILTVNPHASLVTISHEIPSHDIWEGSFTLARAAPFYPEGTVHLAVVDPGVGSARRALVLETDQHRFVGPDNGLFTGVMDRAKRFAAYSITNTSLARETVHPTFHGRDLFGPVAAHLSLGMESQRVGPAIGDPVRLYPPPGPRPAGAPLDLLILHVDRFGNLETDLTPADLHAAFGPGSETRLCLQPGGPPLRFLETYAEGESAGVFALWSSSGHLELARTRDRATDRLPLKPGDRLQLHVG